MSNTCKTPLSGGNPAYYNIVFDVSRYVHVVTIVGNKHNNFTQSKNWFVTVGDKIGPEIVQNNV
jgi:hypothetical protein